MTARPLVDKRRIDVAVAEPSTEIGAMVHLSCDCNPRLAICGRELLGLDENIESECAVCNEMADDLCPYCESYPEDRP